VNERPSRWTPAAARGDGNPGALANATCSLCGIELSIISLIPDGGPGSAEVRWYCRDIVSCTERWTSDRGRRAGHAPVPGRNTPEPDAEPVADGQPAPTADRAPVSGDAQAATEEPRPDPAQEPEPDKVRAGQSGGVGHRDIG
jgi:hypothetical protein